MRVRSIVMFVGAAGFEPAKERHLSGFQSQCVCQFRHAPIVHCVSPLSGGECQSPPAAQRKGQPRIARRIHFAASGIVAKAVASSAPPLTSRVGVLKTLRPPHSHYNGVQVCLFLGWQGCGDLTPVSVGHSLVRCLQNVGGIATGGDGSRKSVTNSGLLVEIRQWA
jgi:hypothetical protein